MTSNPDVPPFVGYVETTVNALRLIHAARQGVIPRITRRLNDSERRTMIKSGAVFIFCVQESQIKRWTDGLLWSPSRIVGNFLVYREINERTSSRGHKKPYPHDDSPTRSLTGKSSPDQTSLGFRTNGGGDQGTFKVGGLIKKTITVVIQESGPEPTHLHLISYYTSEDIRSGNLKRPSTRSDIMSLYMPPHIFRLTTFRVPPKVEIGPDGKPRLLPSSEAEDLEPVECKVEDSGYTIPGSPTWSSQGSPTSPVENPFHGSSLYPLGSGHTSTSSSVYGRGVPNEKWPGQNESMLSPLHRQDMSWSPSGGTALSSGHTMSRRRDGSVMHSETWPSLHPQSGRWQGQSHESSSSSSTSSGGGLYPERPRIRANNIYDDSQIVPRRDHETMAPNFPLRYPPHSTGTREGALQRLHWHSRDTPDSARDPRRCNPQPATNSFSSSPTMPFSSQGYHNTPTYTSSWTSTDNNLMTTPTLHSITQSPLSYDGSYSSNSTSIPSPDEFTNVEGFRDS
ncbi:hypothetical protein BYT27DRAFT_7131611 [Phlegmacium glaucopus]|nr:hypothetical protein BYT27DRAFT_7131611 [Phlegmacium glaucopus]